MGTRLAKDDISRNRPLIRPTDVVDALGLLTRLPLRIDGERAKARGAGSVWAYPLAGLVVGFLATMMAATILALGLTPGLAAGVFIAVTIALTGALHEDGLADSFDGLWGGWTIERRLEIMKDSRIGTYGVLALVLSILLRWTALSTLLARESWFLLPALEAASRAAMPMLMYALPNARSGGLSSHVGRPGLAAASLAVALGLAALALSLPMGKALLAGLAMAGTTALWALIARARLGGQTGDILGAAQQISLLAGLFAAVAADAG